MASPPRQVVFWSGGADSTLVLHQRVLESCKETCSECGKINRGKVLALTVSFHRQIAHQQMKNQVAAQRRYLKHVRKAGFEVEHKRIEVRSEADIGMAGQASLWLCHLAPYLWFGDIVSFGYIRHDDFWHYRTPFYTAFSDLFYLMDWECSTSGFERPQMKTPLEWKTKTEVLTELHKLGIPDDLWWSCERPKNSKTPCGKCNKCKALAKARANGIPEIEEGMLTSSGWERSVKEPKKGRTKAKR